VNFKCLKIHDFEKLPNLWPKNVMQQKIFLNIYGRFDALIRIKSCRTIIHKSMKGLSLIVSEV